MDILLPSIVWSSCARPIMVHQNMLVVTPEMGFSKHVGEIDKYSPNTRTMMLIYSNNTLLRIWFRIGGKEYVCIVID